MSLQISEKFPNRILSRNQEITNDLNRFDNELFQDQSGYIYLRNINNEYIKFSKELSDRIKIYWNRIRLDSYYTPAEGNNTRNLVISIERHRNFNNIYNFKNISKFSIILTNGYDTLSGEKIYDLENFQIIDVSYDHLKPANDGKTLVYGNSIILSSSVNSSKSNNNLEETINNSKEGKLNFTKDILNELSELHKFSEPEIYDLDPKELFKYISLNDELLDIHLGKNLGKNLGRKPTSIYESKIIENIRDEMRDLSRAVLDKVTRKQYLKTQLENIDSSSDYKAPSCMTEFFANRFPAANYCHNIIKQIDCLEFTEISEVRDIITNKNDFFSLIFNNSDLNLENTTSNRAKLSYWYNELLEHLDWQESSNLRKTSFKMTQDSKEKAHNHCNRFIVEKDVSKKFQRPLRVLFEKIYYILLDLKKDIIEVDILVSKELFKSTCLTKYNNKIIRNHKMSKIVESIAYEDFSKVS